MEQTKNSDSSSERDAFWPLPGPDSEPKVLYSQVHRISVPPSERINGPAHESWISVRFLLANLLCLILVAWSIVLVVVPIYIGRASQFNNTNKTVYAVCITIIASCFNLYLVGHLRSEWLRMVDLQLQVQDASTSVESLNRYWRTALGISSLKERLIEQRTWVMQFSLLFSALLTSALVAAMTPTVSSDLVPFSLGLPTGDASGCTTIYTTNSSLSPVDAYLDSLKWPLKDGRTFAAFQAKTCPAGQIIGLMGQLNDAAPDRYVYSTQGTAIHSSAIGSHQALVTYDTRNAKNYTTPLQNATDSVGSDLESTRQCVPVLTSNPVKCRAGGKMSVPDSTHLFVSNGPNCNHTAGYNFNVTLNSTHAMTAAVCAGDRVGQGNAIFAATNDYAAGLAGSINDIGSAFTMLELAALNAIKDGSPTTYSLVCDFDIAAAIGWRWATLDVQHAPTADVPFSRMLYANGSCDALADVREQYAAMAATGFQSPLAQFTPSATQLSTLAYHALAHPGVPSVKGTNGLMRAGPWAFNESKNALEDVLGLVAGLAMSQVPEVDATSLADYETLGRVPQFRQQGSYRVQITRIGPGKAWAVVFAVPPLVAWVFVIWLRWLVVRGRPAATYQSSQLMDLIDLGRSRSI